MGPGASWEKALAKALKKLSMPSVQAAFEYTGNPAHGDYATNIAMRLAPQLKRAPIVIAQEIAEALQADSQICRVVDKVEVVPPGFINVFLSPAGLQSNISTILSAGADFGRSISKSQKLKVQIEFISANPTGPLTLANGRGGFLGDCLSNVLGAAGYGVTREYYVNDAGEQVRKLGWSVLAVLGHETPYRQEELYQGDYIKVLAKKLKRGIKKTDAKTADIIAKDAAKILLADIKRAVKKAGITFDVWFSERKMRRGGLVDETLKVLKRKKLVEEKEGALWLKAQDLGESKDKVLIKSSGDPTYLLPDLAYHWNKLKVRKFNTVIDIVGADHHGHMQALKAGLKALGLKQPDVILVQLVRLIEKGQEVKMSKRAGTFVTLEELLDAVGSDVARWFFLQSSPTSHMDFDLGLARQHSDKNPVYYVQYAHARIASILRKARDAFAEPHRTKTQNHAELLTHPNEIALMKQLIKLPDLIIRTSKNYEVHHLTTYAKELATAFHTFYRDCHVISEDKELTSSRLALCRATQIALTNTLRLMGISAPEKM